jgi:tetraprenyl-beta-curcumene synthase
VSALAAKSPAKPAPSAGLALARSGRTPALLWVFPLTVCQYLFEIAPKVQIELDRCRGRASAIPDPTLRRLALAALAKDDNMRGAALFAALAPRAHRRQTIRALVGFQAAYNYLDMLSEQPSGDPVGNGYRLHLALLAALNVSEPDVSELDVSEPDVSELDVSEPGVSVLGISEPGVSAGTPGSFYYACSPWREDGGYLEEMLRECGSALATLPSRDAVALPLTTAVRRIVAFQSLNLSARQGGHEALEHWADRSAVPRIGLRWWETAAAAGSSLPVHALVALAASPDVVPVQADALERAYFPFLGALHSLLDSLVDRAEDRRHGELCLIDCYPSAQTAAARVGLLAERSRAALRTLPAGARHRVLLTAMACFYLASARGATPATRTLAREVVSALGALARPVLLLCRARRLTLGLRHRAARV